MMKKMINKKYKKEINQAIDMYNESLKIMKNISKKILYDETISESERKINSLTNLIAFKTIIIKSFEDFDMLIDSDKIAHDILKDMVKEEQVKE